LIIAYGELIKVGHLILANDFYYLANDCYYFHLNSLFSILS